MIVWKSVTLSRHGRLLKKYLWESFGLWGVVLDGVKPMLKPGVVNVYCA